MADEATNDLTRQLRRWGPLGAIAVIVIVVIIVIAASGGDDGDDGDAAPDTPGEDTDPDTTDTDADDPDDDSTAPATPGEDNEDTDPDTPGENIEADGVVFWSEAEAAGITGDYEWGDRCDTSLGTLAYPSTNAAECVVPFEGDNGGATSPGVTADTITIVYYTAPEVDPVLDYVTGPINNDDTPEELYETYLGLTDMFTSYLELYGREVELIHYPANGTSDDEVAAIADAETIANDIQPFMVWGAPALQGTVWAETLAANGIMCTCGGGVTGRENFPYLHASALSGEQNRILLAEYIGKRLGGGRNAVHSGDFQDTERKFAYLYLETSEVSTQVANDFRDNLADNYGVELAEMVPYELDPLTLQEQAATRIATLKEAGVTSIIFAGDPIAPRDFTLAATEQEYFPEWILAGTVLVDTNVFARTYDQDQWRHAFGMSNLATRVDPRERGLFHLYDWWTGEEPPADETVQVMVSAGLSLPTMQAAGPNLTPEAYMEALFSAEPTNRGKKTEISGSYGTDHGLWPDELLPDMNGGDNVSEIWWDPDTVGVDELENEGPGVYWWVGGGTRYLPGEWPDTEPDVFNPDNAEFFYDEIPPDELPPDYPSPAG